MRSFDWRWACSASWHVAMGTSVGCGRGACWVLRMAGNCAQSQAEPERLAQHDSVTLAPSKRVVALASLLVRV